MKTQLHYVIISGGDGSAYPSFVESEELATWIEGHESEGFTEAAGSLTLKSDSAITIENLETNESFFLEYMVDEWSNFSKDDIKDYLETFFSGVRPIFEVRDSDKEGYISGFGEKLSYFYVDIYYENKLIKSDSYEEGTSREKILKELNG